LLVANSDEIVIVGTGASRCGGTPVQTRLGVVGTKYSIEAMVDVAVTDHGAAICIEILGRVAALGASSDRLRIRGTRSKNATVRVVAGLTTCLSKDDGWNDAQKDGEIARGHDEKRTIQFA
jgi:hypothetical protein